MAEFQRFRPEPGSELHENSAPVEQRIAHALESIAEQLSDLNSKIDRLLRN